MFESTDTEHLESELVGLAGHLAAGQCRFLQLVAEFDSRGGWAGPGLRSCAHWLSWRVGLSLRTARDQVRVGHALRGLPAVTAAFAAGRLSYAKVRAITRIATPETERELLDLALVSTASQVERLVREARRAGLAAARATERRYLRWSWDEDGSLLLRARLPAAEGAALVAAIEAGAAITAAEPPGGCSAEPPEPPEPAEGWSTWRDEQLACATEHAPGAAVDRVGARRADALVGLTTGAHDRFEVVVHVDAETGGAHVQNGPALPPPTLERIGCTARVRALLRDRNGNPLYLGRKRRLVRGRLLRAIQARDQGRCRFPGCDARHYLHGHHIVSWLRGGKTEISNVVLICSFHHRLIHDRGYQLAWAGAELAVRRPDGQVVPATGPPITGDLDYLVESHTERGLAIDDWTITPGWHGERLNIDLVLDSLLPATAAA